MVSGTNTPSLSVPPICFRWKENAEQKCQAVLQTHAAWWDGFPHTRIIFPQDKRVREAAPRSGKKRESALPAWTGIALHKHRRGLAITTKGKSPSVGKALHAAQRCQQGRASPGVHLVLPCAAEEAAGCCWHAAGTQGGRCSCSARQSHTTSELRTDVRKETVSCCSGSKSPS